MQQAARLLLCLLLQRAACQQVFFDTRLEYDPAAVMVPSQLSLRLRVDATTPIYSPARVVLHLPGFVLPGATDETQVALGGRDAGLFAPDAVWSPLSAHIQLFCTDTGLADQTLVLHIVDRFELPGTGLLENDSRLKVALSRDRKEDLSDIPYIVLGSPAVGSFYSTASPTELTWRKAPARQSLQAGQAATLILSFYAHMALFRDDSITVTLPGRGPAESVGVIGKRMLQ
jgi:hypothetical protein